MKPLLWKKLGIREAAAAMCSHLQESGIEASLVGGACVSIYSDNAYESFDLDFVSHEPYKKNRGGARGYWLQENARKALTPLPALLS